MAKEQSGGHRYQSSAQGAASEDTKTSNKRFVGYIKREPANCSYCTVRLEYRLKTVGNSKLHRYVLQMSLKSMIVTAGMNVYLKKPNVRK